MVTWFAKHPSMYREFLRMARARAQRDLKLQPDRAADEAKAATLCAAGCISEADAYPLLGLEPGDPMPLRHPREWGEAQARAAAAPIEMGGGAHVELLYDLCRSIRPAHVVETGVAYGWSSLAILLALETTGSGHLSSIDMPYPCQDNEAYVGIAVPAHLRHRWTLIRRPDRDALRPLLRRLGPIDLAHYDSDKSRPGRRYAYPRLWNALRPGGVLISDDIGDNSVFHEFAQGLGRDPIVIRKDADHFVVILSKPARPG